MLIGYRTAAGAPPYCPDRRCHSMSDLCQKRTRDAGAAADAENCAVCRDAYGDKSLLKCGHSYCSGCIDDQLRVQQGDHRYE